MIDNYDEVMELVEAMKAHLPLPVYAGYGFIRTMRDRGLPIKARRRIMIIEVFYGGDEGGIMCALDKIGEGDEAFVTSLTHLKVVERHPLAKAMKAYQRERKKRLAADPSTGPQIWDIPPQS